MTDHGYHNTQADHYVFVKKFDGDDFLILLLYVDGMLIVGRDSKKIGSLKMSWINSLMFMTEVGSEQVIRDEGHGTG